MEETRKKRHSASAAEAADEPPDVVSLEPGDNLPAQCPEGTVFSIKAGECVSEGPQQMVPQDEAEQPVQCPEGLVFIPGAGCRQPPIIRRTWRR